MVKIPADQVTLEGHIRQPEGAEGLVLFVHGSGSSRHSVRNNFVAEKLEEAGFGSLLFDLLTEEEDTHRESRFDIALLTDRVVAALAWLRNQETIRTDLVHLFGASTGAAAAIRAAARRGANIRSVVSRGGRPDLAGDALGRLTAPCLLIVGENDPPVLEMNREAKEQMRCENELRVIPRATHLFHEPGTLEEVARHAAEWISRH